MSRKHQREEGLLLLLAANIALGPLSTQMIVPALPLLQTYYQVDGAKVQLVLSLSMLTVAFATFAYGSLADFFGRRPAQLMGIAIFILGTGICALAGSIDYLILGRIIQGVGGAGGIVIARAMVRDFFGPDRSAEVIALLAIVMTIAPMVAPLIGGVLSDNFGWQSMFFFMFALGVVVFFWSIMELPESLMDKVNIKERENVNDSSSKVTLKHILTSRKFISIVLGIGLSYATFFTFAAAAPYIMTNVLHYDGTTYGVYFISLSLSFMGGNVLATKLTKVYGTRAALHLGNVIGIMGVLLGIGCWLNYSLSAASLFISISITLFGSGILSPNIITLAINQFPQRAGMVSGICSFMQMLLAALAVQWMGYCNTWYYDNTQIDNLAFPMYLTMLAGVLTVTVCLLLAYRD